MALLFDLFVAHKDEQMFMDNCSLKLNIIMCITTRPTVFQLTPIRSIIYFFLEVQTMNSTNTGMPLFFRYKFFLPKHDLIQILRSPTKLHHLPPPSMTKKCWQVAIVNQSKLWFVQDATTSIFSMLLLLTLT